MKIRAACLAAVAGLAASGSIAFGDEVVFKNNGAGTPTNVGATALTNYVGIGITCATPTSSPVAPLSLTGFDVDIGNGTGGALAASNSIGVQIWVWDFEDAASAGTTPGFQTLLHTEAYDLGVLGFAWNNNTYLVLDSGNPTIPGFGFTAPVQGFTDTECAVTFAVKRDAAGGTNFTSINGLCSIFRTGAASGPTVGTDDNYLYLSASGETNGNFNGANGGYTIGGVGHVSFALYNESSAATPLGIAAAGTNPAIPLASCDPNATVNLLVDVIPGTLPDSTNITVVADTTAMGGTGGPGVSLLDDGLNGDGAAGDDRFGAVANLLPGPEAGIPVPFVVSDGGLHPDVNGTIVVNRDAYPEFPADIKGSGSGSTTISGVRTFNDNDMFAICVSDPATFGASTVGGATWDSQLFMFDAGGFGVLHNDDDPNDFGGATPQANIVNALANVPFTSGGLYYLLITGFNRDPMDNTNAILWNDDDGAGNYNTVRAPDGPGAANPIALYVGGGNAGGAYTITLTGANAVCPADLSNGAGEAKPDCAVDINDLLFFLAGFEAGDNAVDLTDSSFGAPDCAVDVNDLLFFLAHFESGC